MKKVLLIGINTKFIHPNLAIRLLKENTTFDCSLKEFIIKDDNEKIFDYIISNKFEIIGFSCYIWNIEKILQLSKLLKDANPLLIIILGGPEVSFEYKKIIKFDFIDYIIKDEGEIAFHLLLDALFNNKDLHLIDNLVGKDFDNKIKKIELKNIKSAYHQCLDYKNQIIYFETNRGCPFNCSYCLSSTDNKVRFFDIDKIKNDLLFLLNNGAKTIKFLDRNFTTNKKYALKIIRFLEKNKTIGCSFQFEINLDILSLDFLNEVLNLVSKGVFRFEVGVQTLNEESNKLVDRIQNNQRLLENLLFLNQNGKIDIHCDLICGLPNDNLASFKDTFNVLITTFPKELQLGFLKFLKGTKLRNEYLKYHYKFQEAPPYEIIESDSFSKNDILITKTVENVLDCFYNKNIISKSFKIILVNEKSIFDFLFEFGKYFNSLFYKSDKQFIRYFEILISFLKEKNYFTKIYPFILKDYYSHYTIKPKSLGETFEKKEKNLILRQIFNRGLLTLSLDDLFKYSNIVKINQSTILLYIYKNNFKYINILNLE